MKKLILACVLGVSATGSAVAVTAQTGVYLNLNGGYSFPTTFSDSSFAPFTASQSNQGLTGGAAIGFDYALNPNYLIGLEGGYTYFGKTKYTVGGSPFPLNFDTKEEGIQALVTGTYLNPNGFNLFAKAGEVYMSQDFSSAYSAFGSSTSIHAWEPALAAGVGYMPIQNLNIALQYEHIFGSADRNVNDNITRPQAQNAVTLGLTYKFGGLRTY
jgi:opacity protein-like surface antigen